MKFKPYQKGIIFGILTALFTVSIIIGIYYGIPSMSENNFNLLPPFDWDFSTIDKLSLQISERSDYLLAFIVETGIFIEGGGGMFIPHFNYSVFSIHSWYNVEDQQQMLLIEDYLNNESDYETYYTIQPSLLTPLSSALAKDIQTIENYTDIAENYWIEMDAVEEPGAFTMRIKHIYQDGSYIEIRSVENTVFIRYATFNEYFGTHNSWGAALDLDEFDNGRDKYKEFYKAEIPQIFSNHTIAVNLFLENFYSIAA